MTNFILAFIFILQLKKIKIIFKVFFRVFFEVAFRRSLQVGSKIPFETMPLSWAVFITTNE